MIALIYRANTTNYWFLKKLPYFNPYNLKIIRPYSDKPIADSPVDEYISVSKEEMDEILSTKDIYSYSDLFGYRKCITKDQVKKGYIYFANLDEVEYLDKDVKILCQRIDRTDCKAIQSLSRNELLKVLEREEQIIKNQNFDLEYKWRKGFDHNDVNPLLPIIDLTWNEYCDKYQTNFIHIDNRITDMEYRIKKKVDYWKITSVPDGLLLDVPGVTGEFKKEHINKECNTVLDVIHMLSDYIGSNEGFYYVRSDLAKIGDEVVENHRKKMMPAELG